MKYIFPSLVFVTALFLGTGCNKDEEITVDRPEDPTPASITFSVIEYMPAPGQFINESVSGFDNVSTMEEACLYAEKRLAGNLYVSLGAWGGYITVKASSPIPNTEGYDFAIACNAIATSNEPGVVWVMQDANDNGLPDDKWYELRGSDFGKEGYRRDYSVTYFRPLEPGSPVKWVDCDGKSGQIEWLGVFHKQEFYYPEWIEEDSYTLHGTLLQSKSAQNPVTGQWEAPAFEWGYADNIGEDSVTEEVNGKKLLKNYFSISDAIDSSGNAIYLKSIDFIKVQTGVCDFNKVLGESSTEVCGFFTK